MSHSKRPAFSEALLRRLIRAAKAEGWTEIRLYLPGGEVVLRQGSSPAAEISDRAIEAELAAFDRGEL